MKRIAFVIFAVALATSAHASNLPPGLGLTLTNNGDVAGPAGSAVGWGFTLTDTSSDWVVLDDSYFLGSPLYGSYEDYISNQFYLAGPSPESTTVSEPWNQGSQLGTGEFDLFATDPPTSFSGSVNVDYDLFSVDPNDPNFDPDVDFVSSGTFSDPVEITITPEPSSWMLIGLPLAALMLVGYRRQAYKRQ
jgi:hypothetical protein